MSGARNHQTSLEETTATGWDSHSVWQERVRSPQAGMKPAATSAADRAAATGWDPHETWRMRVRRNQQRLGTLEPDER